MAILMIQDAPQDYDAIIKQLEERGLAHPPGRQFHAAARKGDGFVVTDIWESQEALDRFFETLGPMLEQAGGPNVSPPQIYPLHKMIKGS